MNVDLQELYDDATPTKSLIVGGKHTSLVDEIIEHSARKLYVMTSTHSHQEIIADQINTHGENAQIVLLFEDSYNADLNKDKLFRKLMMNGDHYNISIIVVMQTPIVLNPALRIQFDFIYYYNNEATNQKMYEQYFDIFPSFEHFSCYVKIHKCIVLNNATTSLSMTDKIGYYTGNNKLFDTLLDMEDDGL